MKKAKAVLLTSFLIISLTTQICRADFSINDRGIVVAETETELIKSTASLTNKDIFPNSFDPDGKNGVLVVYVSFTDSPEFDRSECEDLFTGVYDADNCLRSVNSYYSCNSYGRDLFDFSFAYYDSGLTVEEAWHLVNDEDAYGNFLGNDFFFNIFKEMQADGAINTSELDKDQDGYVDASVFVFGDKEIDGCLIYGGAQGKTDSYDYPPNLSDPTIGKYIKISYDYVKKALKKGSYDSENTRMLIHEFGHLFGLMDYYDMLGDYDNLISPLGLFDMQEQDVGDWNPFSKFTCGWLQPYVITDDIDSVTIKLRCSSIYNDTILIPTSKGWNGTAFDEYILIDVMAKAGANGFDWSLPEEESAIEGNPENAAGGVRIYHVDARLMKRTDSGAEYITDLYAEDFNSNNIELAHSNTNSADVEIENDSPFYHLIDLIPSDGSSKYRIQTSLPWALFTIFSTNDLFSSGDSFSTEKCADAFADGPIMNNGGTIEYTVTIDQYDPLAQEAIITVSKS